MYSSGWRYLLFSYCLKLLNEQGYCEMAISVCKWTWRKKPEDLTKYWHRHENLYICHSSYRSETQYTVSNIISESEWILLLHCTLLSYIIIQNIWNCMFPLRFLYRYSTHITNVMASHTKRHLFSYEDMFQNALIIWVVTRRQNSLN